MKGLPEPCTLFHLGPHGTRVSLEVDNSAGVWARGTFTDSTEVHHTVLHHLVDPMAGAFRESFLSAPLQYPEKGIPLILEEKKQTSKEKM